jgi:[ribosomal protein S5]-alanine N-acetyltransferase
MRRRIDQAQRVQLVVPAVGHKEMFLEAVRRSRSLHHPWVSPPATPAGYGRYLHRLRQRNHAAYFVLGNSDQLVGVINVSEIVRGAFCSAFLGYFAFAPHSKQGYMTAGLAAALDKAFKVLKLHRVEANIQPGNIASARLVRRLGFRREGHSPRYLKVGGRWRDHDRWALTVEEWKGIR